MPTIAETVQGLRGEATANQLALESVRLQVLTRLAEVESWAASPNKGIIRDALARMAGEFEAARKIAASTTTIATRVLDSMGTVTPDPVPAPTTWSTGAW